MQGELRRTQRFKVESTFPATIFIPQSLTKTYKLRSLGEHGLGFYAPARDASLVQNPEVDIRFTFGGRMLNFKGTVQYCTFLPKHGANYFGIRFLDLDDRLSLLLKTIIQAAVARGHLITDGMALSA